MSIAPLPPCQLTNLSATTYLKQLGMGILLLGIFLLGNLKANVWALSDTLFTAPNPPVPGLRKASPSDHSRHTAKPTTIPIKTKTVTQRLLPSQAATRGKQIATAVTAAAQRSPKPAERLQVFRARRTPTKAAPSLLTHARPSQPQKKPHSPSRATPVTTQKPSLKAPTQKPAMAAKPKQTIVVSGLQTPPSLPATKTAPPKPAATALVQVADGTASAVANENRLENLPSPAEYEEINREVTRQVRSQESFELSDGDDPMLAEWGRVLMGLAIVLGMLYGLKYLLLKWRATRPQQKRTRRLPVLTAQQAASPTPQPAQPTKRRQKTIPTTPPSLSWQEVVQMIAESQSPDEDTAPTSGSNPVGLTRLRRPKS